MNKPITAMPERLRFLCVCLVATVRESGKNGEKTAGRDRRGRFTHGNPGRPKGARHKATEAVEQLMQGQMERITAAVIEAAAGGDMQAARLVLDRIAPRREPAVSLDLPNIESAADLPMAIAAILQAVAAGDLTPTEAAKITQTIEGAGSAMERHDLDRRIADIEARSIK